MKKSAGILLYKIINDRLQILLVHPGGPFWKNKDLGAWTIPKGELIDGEQPLIAAKREFLEEIGKPVIDNCVRLTPIKQKGGKLVHAWASEGEFNVEDLKSNLFEMTWPPKTGKIQSFPEIDKAQWFGMAEGLHKILIGQKGFILELTSLKENKLL